MLVTFLVFALFSMMLLGAVLWWLWPSSRVSTSVPGLSPSHQLLGNIPNIKDAGGLQHFLHELHQRHGMLASFWIGDFLAISLGSLNIFKLVDDCKDTKPFLSLVPITIDPDILERKTKDASNINLLLNNFSPFSDQWNDSKRSRVTALTEELLSALETVGEEDQVPINEYVKALAVKIVTETSNKIEKMKVDPNELRQRYVNLGLDVDALLDSEDDLSKDRKEKLFQQASDFIKLVNEKNAASVFGDITVITALAVWCLYYAARNQFKLRDEKNISLFIFEVMRATAILPVTSRVLQRSVTILGHTVEEGTLVLNSLSAVCWDEKRFPNAREPNIQRNNLGEFQNLFPTADQSFTLTVVRIIVRMFIERFTLTLADPDLCVGTKFNMVNKPDCDIWLKLKKN